MVIREPGGESGSDGVVDRRGSVPKIRRKSDDGGGNKEGDFGRKQEDTKAGCISTLPFPLSHSLSAIDPDRPLARRIIIFGAKLNKTKKIQTILTKGGGPADVLSVPVWRLRRNLLFHPP